VQVPVTQLNQHNQEIQVLTDLEIQAVEVQILLELHHKMEQAAVAAVLSV
jgi:hypothetical protein